jgi:integrase
LVWHCDSALLILCVRWSRPSQRRSRDVSALMAERAAFLDAAMQATQPIRTLCSVLYYTGCRVSEALELTSRRVDINDQVLIFETLKKRRRGSL